MNPKKPHSSKVRKPIPFEFVLDELSALDLHTRPMFGCTVARRPNSSDSEDHALFPWKLHTQP
jgi:hypothetical protein